MSNNLYSIRVAVSLLLTLVAVVTDLRSRRIPNLLMGLGMGVGIYLALAAGGLRVLPGRVGAMLLPLVCPGILFFLGMLGGGDIKLLMALGSLLGLVTYMRVLTVTFLCAGIQALLFVLWKGNGKERLRCLRRYLQNCVRAGRPLPYTDVLSREEIAAGQIHFTVSILAGLAFTVCIRGHVLP